MVMGSFYTAKIMMKSLFCDFDRVRRSEVADFIAASCRSRSLVSYAAIKSAILLRRSLSNRQNEVEKISKNQENRSNSP